MATTTIQQKIQSLKKKISVKNTRINKLMNRISESKSEIKSAKKEIVDMEIEIKQLELEQLSDTLFQNGITTADVAAAIAAGDIKKSPSPQSDSVDDESADEDPSGMIDRLTYSTNSDEEEAAENEVSGS